MMRGSLRVYLGAAPGVGKTVAMLDEGRRRADRGSDVIVGIIETHGRPTTALRLEGLEIVPRRRVEYRGSVLEELDLDRVLERRPEVVLVDELAHTNAPGSRNTKRWGDISELLDAGIHVISTVNVQHLESLNDVVHSITGVVQRETVPDAFVRSADQIELVDMSPEALRRRMAHGNIYPPDRIDAALSNYFRPGNLGALRELALLWVADRVEAGLEQYRSAHGIDDRWETRERIVVAVTAHRTSVGLIRRAARMAARARGELIGVHVRSTDGLRDGPDTDDLVRHRELVAELGGTFHEIAGDDVPEALVSFASARKATQLVLGSSGRSRWTTLWRGSVISRTITAARGIDVHVIADPGEAPARTRLGPRRRNPLPRRRVALGWSILAVGLPLVTVVATAQRNETTLATELLVYLGLVVAAAAVGGVFPAVAGAVAASLLANYFLVEPHHTFTINEGENALALLVFVAIAATVSFFVTVAAQRAHESLQARTEAEALARSASALVDATDPLATILEQLRHSFGLPGIALFREDGAQWRRLGGAGVEPRAPTDGATVRLGDSDQLRLSVAGDALYPDVETILHRHADQITLALARRDRQAEAARLAALEQIDELRTAMLHAVSHDLRTPLTSIKTAVTSLLARDVAWSGVQTEEFLATVDEQTDRLTALVENLLDMSRLEAGVLSVRIEPVAIDDVVGSAIRTVDPAATAIEVLLPDDGIDVLADVALLERALANVVANAVRYAGPRAVVHVEATTTAASVIIAVIDHGPGIPDTQRTIVVRPFQRLGDRGVTTGAGVGLGLAIADGFVRAMGGTFSLLDTPGGGLTVEIVLPRPPLPRRPDRAEPGDHRGRVDQEEHAK